MFDPGGFWQDFADRFYNNFIQENRWRCITDGLQITLVITFVALLFGLVLGFVIAIIRVTYDTTGNLGPLNALVKFYVTVIRGTPTALQLMILYFVILSSMGVDKLIAAIIGFGLNSGAYVSEIFRAGIMSIDTGQMEAGRSLGLNYIQTMRRILIPQAIKNVLPAIGNECITLLKETSVASYIAVEDLTQGGRIIQSRTFEAFFPLVGVALIYLVLVMILQAVFNAIERRFARGDRR